MGYNLTIGNARLNYDKEYNTLTVEAEGTSHPSAPIHCPFTGNGSSRSPSYTGWSEFCKEAGEEVYAMFYGSGWNRDYRMYDRPSEQFLELYPRREIPILSNHPGYQPLCQDDLTIVRQARIEREKLGKEPGFWDDDNVDNGKDHVLARLLWLEFWIDWALKNCEIPILENT